MGKREGEFELFLNALYMHVCLSWYAELDKEQVCNICL